MNNENFTDANMLQELNDKNRTYWKKKLSGDILKVEFIHDYVDIVNQEKHNSSITYTIPEEVSERIFDISKKSDIRVYSILVTSLVILLNKYTDMEDIIVGSPVYKNEINDNCLNRAVVLRNTINDNKSFKELVLQVSQSIFEAHENLNYPIDKIIEELNGCCSDGGSSIFDIGVVLENISNKTDIGATNILFTFNRINNCLEASIEYKSSIYEKQTVDRIKNHYINVLREVVFNTDIKICDIDMLSEKEKTQLIYDFNNTYTEFSRESTIHKLFEEQVIKTPNSIAVVNEEKHLTYEELNVKANQLANLLRERGARTEDVIAIIMDRSIEMIVSLLGILKAGCAYMPISPEIPIERISSMIEECDAKILLTNTSTIYNSSYSQLKGIIINNISYDEPENIKNCDTTIAQFGEECLIEIIILDQIDELLIRRSGQNIDAEAGISNLAYVMFTSGSTGRPKGVMIEHRSAVNVLNWFGTTSRLKEDSRIVLMYDYTSDPSVEDIFAPLIFGGTLYVTDKYLIIDKNRFRTFVEENKITVLNFVPRVIKQLLSGEPKLESLDIVLSGGEELEDYCKDELLEKGYEVFNDYGPTEATIDCLSKKCTKDKVTIGSPIDNMQCYILDKNNNIKPIGAIGELCISGVGLARGYINRPKLTEEKFISNPFIKGERMYKTGDLARWNNNGEVEFFGRIDSQVKIRGFRIELLEIEMALRNHKDLKDATVIVRDDRKKDKYLCAYIVEKNTCRIAEIKEYLSKRLPHYMIPTAFIKIEKIPLNLVGKVDKKTLLEIEIEPSNLPLRDVQLNDDIDTLIYDIWSEVLGNTDFDLDDNFFEIGGTSMDIIRVNETLNELLGIKLPVVAMFKYSTIKEIGEYIKCMQYDDKLHYQ